MYVSCLYGLGMSCIYKFVFTHIHIYMYVYVSYVYIYVCKLASFLKTTQCHHDILENDTMLSTHSFSRLDDFQR